MRGALNLLVLYVTDLDASVRFYTACGLTFTPERHSSGPLHFSATTPGGVVLELYPSGAGAPTRTRIGFAVDDAERVASALAAAGWPEASEPRDLDYGRVRVVRDPDGNAVELVEPRETLPVLHEEEGDDAKPVRDAAYWEGLSRAVEAGEYTVSGPVEYGPGYRDSRSSTGDSAG